MLPAFLYRWRFCREFVYFGVFLASTAFYVSSVTQ
jgi:hypothetical protein